MTYYIYYLTSYPYNDRDNYTHTQYDYPEYISGDSYDDIKNKINNFIYDRSMVSANLLIKDNYYNFKYCIAKLETGKWPDVLSENGVEFITPIFYIDDDKDDVEDTNYSDRFMEQLHIDTLAAFKNELIKVEQGKKKIAHEVEQRERLLLEKLKEKYPN